MDSSVISISGKLTFLQHRKEFSVIRIGDIEVRVFNQHNIAVLKGFTVARPTQEMCQKLGIGINFVVADAKNKIKVPVISISYITDCEIGNNFIINSDISRSLVAH